MCVLVCVLCVGVWLVYGGVCVCVCVEHGHVLSSLVRDINIYYIIFNLCVCVCVCG